MEKEKSISEVLECLHALAQTKTSKVLSLMQELKVGHLPIYMSRVDASCHLRFNPDTRVGTLTKDRFPEPGIHKVFVPWIPETLDPLPEMPTEDLVQFLSVMDTAYDSLGDLETLARNWLKNAR